VIADTTNPLLPSTNSTSRYDTLPVYKGYSDSFAVFDVSLGSRRKVSRTYPTIEKAYQALMHFRMYEG
jgi:hypothetical protein